MLKWEAFCVEQMDRRPVETAGEDCGGIFLCFCFLTAVSFYTFSIAVIMCGRAGLSK